jgi:hypothetical protein
VSKRGRPTPAASAEIQEFIAGALRPAAVSVIQDGSEIVAALVHVKVRSVPGLRQAFAAHDRAGQRGDEGLDVTTQWVVFPGDQEPGEPALIRLNVHVARPRAQFALLFDLAEPEEEIALLTALGMGTLPLMDDGPVHKRSKKALMNSVPFGLPLFDSHVVTRAIAMHQFDMLPEPEQKKLMRTRPATPVSGSHQLSSVQAHDTVIDVVGKPSGAFAGSAIETVELRGSHDGRMFVVVLDESEDDGLSQLFAWRRMFDSHEEFLQRFDVQGQWQAQGSSALLAVDVLKPMRLNRVWAMPSNVNRSWLSQAADGGQLMLAPSDMANSASFSGEALLSNCLPLPPLYSAEVMRLARQRR